MSGFGLLGLGSNNMLNSNLIDSMRASDQEIQISPIEDKLETVDMKFERIIGLKTQVNALSDAASALGSELTFLDVNTFTSTSGIVWANAESGVKPQTFSIDVTQKARADVFQTNKVLDTNAQLNALGAESITYTVGANPPKTLDFPQGTSMQGMVDIINQSGDMTASILKVSDTEFRLSIKGVSTGLANAITFNSVGAELDAALGITDPLNHMQPAQNALFLYNDVQMERSTNQVDDIIYGVSLELADIGKTDVVIEPNYEAVVSMMDSFVDLYNQTNLMVKANVSGSEEGDGLFRTTREIYNMMGEINARLFETDLRNNDSLLKSVVDIGFEKQKDGSLTFDKSDIENLMLNHFEDVTKLFANADTGVFSKVDEVLEKVTNIQGTGSLDTLTKQLGKEDERLSELKERTQARLDKQYELMEQRFAAFDALISRMDAGFSSLKLQIDQSVANNSN